MVASVTNSGTCQRIRFILQFSEKDLFKFKIGVVKNDSGKKGNMSFLFVQSIRQNEFLKSSLSIENTWKTANSVNPSPLLFP
jgi:hypothetical protein